MITCYDASLLKDSFLNTEAYPESCQTSKMEFFIEYSQRLKAVDYFHEKCVKRILNTPLECISLEKE